MYISRKGKNNSYNHVPGGAGRSKKNGSSNQSRNAQGREKRRPSALMVREQ